VNYTPRPYHIAHCVQHFFIIMMVMGLYIRS